MSPAPPPQAAPPASTLVQDGSYMQALGLKLSEAVAKAVAQPVGPPAPGEPVVDGKRPLPPGRGKALGALIASELRATEGNAGLQRAVQRLLQRPLSILLTSLNAHLLPLLSTPAFSQFIITHANGPFNPTQVIALSLAALAAETLETFDALGLGTAAEPSGSSGRSTPGLGDGLRGIREGLESVVTKVIGPMFAGIRKELHPLLDALEHPPLAPSPPLKPASSTKAATAAAAVHPSILTLTQTLPSYGKALQRLVALSPAAHASLASCLISLVWRTMVALAHRPHTPLPRTPPILPAVLPLSSTNGTTTAAPAPGTKKRIGAATPPGTPSATRFLIKLPSSRPPSPPSTNTGADPLEMEAKAVYDALRALPQPAEGANVLARDAVVEGFEAFEAFIVLLRNRGDAANVPEDVPTLIALPVLLRAAGVPGTVASLLEFGEAEYRENCLSGFVRAAECGPVIARQLLGVLRDCEPALVEWLRSRAP
ncbi:hypothetical protein AURDEDRAFT_142400 [Auricularia subglabra TFB-10046 SS5]|nr:hypothetical protein AURDEDRAFT_142400 [Auricularia subglabra TFB-10046 SS5]